MVLEEAVNESAGGSSNYFSSDASRPNSDADPWSSANNSETGDKNVKIDASKLPRPLPILGTLFGFTQTGLQLAISSSIGLLAQRVGRQLREDECQAIAYHTAKGAAISSYGMPLGIAVGVWRARKTRESYRFPFYKPNPKTFNANKLGPLVGTRAQTGWHILRTASYALVGGSFGKFLLRSYAVTVAVAGWRLDPRMKDVIEVLGRKGREMAEARQRSAGVDKSGQGSGVREQQQQQQQRQYRQGTEQAQRIEFINTRERDGSGQPQQDFDASPTAYPWFGGNDGLSTSTYGSDERREGSDSSNSQAWSQTRQPYQPQRRANEDLQRSSGRMTSGRGDARGDFDLGNSDDNNNAASPIASSPYRQESAWERIRRGASSDDGGGGSSSQSPASARSSSRSEADTPAYNAWDRARAQRDAQQSPQYQSREDAQRAFDAQLERERQGETS